MEISNKSYQSMAKKQIDAGTSIGHCKENTAAIKRINNQIKNLLDKIPLNNQREVVQINRLIEEQERLLRVKIKGNVPLRIETLNSNEKHRAIHLRRRFREALRSGKIRK